jgi:Negative regulator of sigma F
VEETLDCRDVRDALVRGEVPEGPEVQAHLGGCPACAYILADHALLGRELGRGDPGGAPAVELSALLGQVEQSIQSERGVRARLRSLSTPWRIACALAAVGVVAGFVLVFKPRPDLSAYPIDRMALTVAFYALLIGGAFALELRPLQRRALPGWVRPLLAVVALAVPVVFALAPSPEVAAPAMRMTGSFAHLTFGCFMFGTGLAVPVLVLLFLLDRRAHGTWGVVVLAAAAGGLVANLGLALHCPARNVAHILLGHASIGVVLVVAYVLALALRKRHRRAAS